MNRRTKKLLRTAQTRFPVLTEAKFSLQRSFRRFVSRPFDPDFRALRLFPRVPEQVFLDVGGNRGQSIDAIRLYNPDARIVSFEPNPILARRLTAMFRDDPNVTIHAIGLGLEAGRSKLYVPSYRGFVFDGLASTKRSEAAGWLNSRRIYGFDENDVDIHEHECQVEALDSLGLEPFFVKIDVQGSEFEVLRGGEACLAEHQPVLLIENYGEEEQFRFLARLGYEVFGFDGEHFHPGPQESKNNFFMTPEKQALVRSRVLGR